jgi:hypothetical protein
MSVPQEVKGARHDALLEDDGTENAINVNFNDFLAMLGVDNVQDAIDALAAAGVFDFGPISGTAVGDHLRWNGTGWVNTRLAWVPLMGNSPNIVTTDGTAVWLPITTVDGDPIMIESLT